MKKIVLLMRDKFRRKYLATTCLLCLSLMLDVSHAAWAQLTVSDDSGAQVSLRKPARRVISLAPHITELIYAAGGGARLVGTVAYSDYPSEARRLPRVGDSRTLDLERIVALQPDLIVAWHTGNTQRQFEALRALQIPIFYSEPRTLEAVATNLESLGILLNTQTQARAATTIFRHRLEALRRQYAQRPPVSVFYQVWDAPLMTLNGQHIVNEIIVLCGGRNIFAKLKPLAPTVSTEAVLAADPQAIIATHPNPIPAEKLPANLARWRRWPTVKAVAQHHLFALDSDLIDRPGPRLIKGATQICQSLQIVRQKSE